MAAFPTLTQLYAEHHGKVSDKWAIYIAEYERLFTPYRGCEIAILEIGIQNGGSLEIWAKFFPNAKAIIGCEINEACRQLEFEDSRISLFIGDANDDAVSRSIISSSHCFELVIDDGSHRSDDIAQSFAHYFPYVANGGMYVAEDLHCSYWSDFVGGIYNPLSSMSFFKMLADVINHEHWGVAVARADILIEFREAFGIVLEEQELEKIHSVEFVNSLCVVKKRAPQENVLGARVIAGTSALIWEGALELQGSLQVVPDQSANPWVVNARSISDHPAISRNLPSKTIPLIFQKNGTNKKTNIEAIELGQVYLQSMTEISHGIAALSTQLDQSEKRVSFDLAEVLRLHDDVLNKSAEEAERACTLLDSVRAKLFELERGATLTLAHLADIHQAEKATWSSDLIAVRQDRDRLIGEQSARETFFSAKMEEAERTHKQLQEHFLALMRGAEATRIRELENSAQLHSKERQLLEKEIGSLRGNGTELKALLNIQTESHGAFLALQQNRIDDLQHQAEIRSTEFYQRERSLLLQLETAETRYKDELTNLNFSFNFREELLHQNLLEAQRAISQQMIQLAQTKDAYAQAVRELKDDLNDIRGNLIWRWTSKLNGLFATRK